MQARSAGTAPGQIGSDQRRTISDMYAETTFTRSHEALSAESVLQLQRCAGNRATTAMILSPVAVQRCGPIPCDCDEEEQEEWERSIQRECDPSVASCPPTADSHPDVCGIDTETAATLAEIDARSSRNARASFLPPSTRPVASVLRQDANYAFAATVGLVGSNGFSPPKGLLATEGLATAEGTAAAEGLLAANGTRTASTVIVEGSSLARSLIAGGEAILAAEAAGGAEVEAATGPPGWVVGAIVLLVAGAAIGTGYLLLRNPTPQPQASSQPQTSTQAAPQTQTRRNPNQTCEDSVLDALQAEKDRICNSILGTSCSPSKVSPKRLSRMPCSEIRARIQAMRACMAIRQRIQDECFGGRPDQAHQDAMNFLQNGVNHCLALEAINCAPGHPMAGL